MIKFFRHIRQKLLRENRISKYFLYAIGEILLVVIGILIALQINNWNEAQKNHAYEIKMLSEIIKGLETDDLNLKEHIDANKFLKSTVEHFTKLTNSRAIFHDSLYPQLWNLNTGRYFHFNRGPYDALKSSGIDRISNDSLRNHLINFFDFKLGVFESQLAHVNRRYRPNVETLLSFRADPYLDNKNTWVVNQIPKDIFQKPKFIWLLTDIEWRANNAIDRIENFIPEINNLILHINTEINP